MSICRWSDDDYQCSLYIYESEDWYVIHVAKRKPIYKEELPPRVDTGNLDDILKRQKKVWKMHDRAEFVPIGLPYDGEMFIEKTPEDLLKKVIFLKEIGYRVPDFVIRLIKQEIEDKEE